MGKGMVRKIRFAPGKENSKILMLFNEEVQVYDRVTVSIYSFLLMIFTCFTCSMCLAVHSSVSKIRRM